MPTAAPVKTQAKSAAPKTAASGAARVVTPEPPQKQFGNRTINAIVQRKCACGGSGGGSSSSSGSSSDEPCDACRDRSRLQTMQRRAPASSGPIAANPTALRSRLGAGAPLPVSVRAHYERGLGHDLSAVRIHTGTGAAELARDFHALAFTLGADVAFAPGRYNTATEEGRALLGHELAHVVQQSAASPAAIASSYDALEREADRAAARLNTGLAPVPPLSAAPAMIQAKGDPTGLDNVLDLRMTAGFDGLFFQGAETAEFNLTTSWIRQATAGFLKRLLGSQYTPGELEDETIAACKLALTDVTHKREQEARNNNGSKKVGKIRLYALPAIQVIDFLRGKGLSVNILPAQEEVLRLGQLLPELYKRLIAAAAASPAGALPAWYTEPFFTQDITNFGANLRAFNTALAAEATQRADAERLAVLELYDAITPAIRVLEAIRVDADLTSLPQYSLVWGTAVPAAGATAPIASANSTLGIAGIAMLAFIRTQPVLIVEAVQTGDTGKQARKELLVRFARFFERVPFSHDGDLRLADKPPKYNTAPLKATLSSYPAVEPPFYDLSMSGETAFTMSLKVNDFAEAWASLSYIYRFEQILIPPERYRNSATAAEKTETFSRWSLYKDRLARDTSYNAADVRRIIGRQRVVLGDPGMEVGLATLNSLLRYAGTTIHTIFEPVFGPNYVASFTFPAEGLYMIRCIAAANTPENAAVIRPPSIAYLPVFAVDPLVLTERRLQMELSVEEKNKARLAEIDLLLKTDPANQALLDEKARIEKQSTVLGTLELARDELDAMLKANKLSGPEKEAIEKRLEQIKEILTMRGKRTLTNAFRVPAVFVGDKPPRTTHLVLEAVDQSDPSWPATRRKVYVSDATTPLSGDDDCEVELSAEQIGRKESALRLAVLCAAKKILESDMGYGRGYLTVVVDGASAGVRIEADEWQILLEGVSNAAMVASIAVIAAAPFTGGASLTLLIPIGIVGAVPSAYRIASRAEAGNLRWDMATAMDLVNVASAFVGLGAEAAAARQAFKVGAAMMITGFGMDGLNIILLGADVVIQLEALKDLPPEFRSVQAAEIIGNALFQAGIMAAGMLAAHARGKQMAAKERSITEWKESLPEKTRAMLDEPGVFAKFSEMSARVRELLTHCSDFCIPKYVTKDQATRIEELLKKHGGTPDDEAALRTLFHDQVPKDPASAGPATQIAKLEAILQQLEAHPDAKSFRAFLDQAVPVPDRVLGFNPNLRQRTDLRDLVNKLADPTRGGISTYLLAKIVDQCNQRGVGVERMLGYLDKLSTRKSPGWDHVVGDLAKGYGFFTGAEWVLRWLEGANKWDDVAKFEADSLLEVGSSGRRWDVIMKNLDIYQFKNWSQFWQSTFLKQIHQDYDKSGAFKARGVRWVFEPKIGSKSDVATHMRNALDAAAQANDARFPQAKQDAILNYLDKMIIVGVTP